MLNTTRSKYLHKLTKSLREIIPRYRENEHCGIRKFERSRIVFFILRVPIYIESVPRVHAVYNINVTLYSDQWSSEN